MARGTQDLGNGNGYIHITDLNDNPKYSYPNTTDGIKQVLSLNLFALPVTGDIIPNGTIIVDTAANAGADTITEIRVGGFNLLDSAVSITDADEEQTAADIATAINISSQASSSVKYRAEAYGTDVTISPTNLTNNESQNGKSVTVIFSGASVINTVKILGGVNGSSSRSLETDAISEIIDTNKGIKVWIDANYPPNNAATYGDITSAEEITKYFLNWSLANKLDTVKDVSVLDNNVVVERYSAITRLAIDAPTTKTISQISTNSYLEGDMIILTKEDAAYEFKILASGNVLLSGDKDFESLAGQMDSIILNAIKVNGVLTWVELSRSNAGGSLELTENIITNFELAENAVGTNNIIDQSVTAEKLADGAVSGTKIASGTITTDKVSEDLRTVIVSFNVSFETGELGDYKVKVPWNCDLREVYASVVTDIQNSNDATIVPKNQSGTVINDGIITLPAGSVNGVSVSETVTNLTTFNSGDVITLTTAKTNAGGSAMVTLVFTKAATATGGGALYLVPSFSNFQLTGYTILEVGNEIPAGAQTFTWATENSGNVAPNTISIIDVTGGSTVLASAISNDGSEPVTFVSAISKTSIATHQFRIEGIDTQANSFGRNYNVDWQFRKFYGNDVNAGALTEVQIEALANNPLSAGYAGEYFFPSVGSPEYKYFAFPVSWGTPTSFKDKVTGFAVPMEASYIVNITNTATTPVSEDYNIYRTTNASAGDITIVVA